MKNAHLSPYQLACFMDKHYDYLSSQFAHGRNVLIPTTEAEWEEVFKLLNIVNDNEKRALKIAVEALEEPGEDYDVII